MLNKYLITTSASPEAVARAGFDQLQIVGHGDYTLFREANGPEILQAFSYTLAIEEDDETPTWETLNSRQRAIILQSAAESCYDEMPELDPVLLDENFVKHHKGLDWLLPSSQWPLAIKKSLTKEYGSDYIAIAFDVSSAPSDEYLNHVWSNLHEIVQHMQSERVRVIQADNSILDDFSYSHETLPQQLSLSSQGGTSYVPVFQTLQQDPPQALIYVCDLYGDHQRLNEPDWPVFWITPENHCPIRPEFGTVFVSTTYPDDAS